MFYFEIRISFFSLSRWPGIPHETVLNLSTWLNICTSNRAFNNDRRSCWPIACIYFMKNLLLWARLPHIYIWNNELKHTKDTTCKRTLCYHKTECDACLFFLSTVPRCERKSWISVQQLLKCRRDAPMWSHFERESERERVKERRLGTAESLTLFSNDWFNQKFCVDLFTHLTYMLFSINVCRNFPHYNLESCGNE